MVPRIVDDQGCEDACEDQLLSACRLCANTKTHLAKEELALAIEIERRRQRFRVAALCCIAAGIGTACAIAAYSFAWSSWSSSKEWKNYVREASLDPEALYKPIEDHILYIGILSEPDNFKQRMLARRTWVDDARRAFNGEVKIEFLVRHAPSKSFASSEVKAVEKRLRHEASYHSDVTRIPVGPSAQSESDQVLWIFENALNWKARFVAKATDSEMVAVGAALARLKSHYPWQPPVYFGQVWTPDTVQEADGETSWFFQGCFGISGGLAQKISVIHGDHTVGIPLFGSTNAGVNVAKWMNYEDSVRRQATFLPVKHVWMPKLCSKIPGIPDKDVDLATHIPTPNPQGIVDDGIPMTEWKAR